MSPAFIAVAVALALVAAALVAIPLLRRREGDRASPWTALVAACVMVGSAVSLYSVWSNWGWPDTGNEALTPAAMVGRLARRLEKDPADLQGWLRLARSYSVMEQYPLAIRAYQRADTLAAGKNAEALVGLAEALTLQDEKTIDGRAGKLFEQALALDPASPNALFFGAVAAQRRGELPLARERYERLLTLNPPERIRPIIEQQIAAIAQATVAGAPQAGPLRPGAAQPGAPPVAASEQPAAAGSEPSVKIHVTVAPAMAQHASGGAPLFVMIRDPAQPGPPLAARRLAADLPQSVELTPADAMLPGRTFRKGQVVEVVARVARGGTATAQKGDPYGQVKYEVGKDGVREIVIDRLAN